MFDSKLPISYYKEIAALDENHNIFIVQHIESHKIFLKKQISVYNIGVFEELFKHPIKNTPRIYAMYDNNNVLTLIEEYISGYTLQEVQTICGYLAEKEVISYSIQLCDILTDLHSMSPAIIHRDIKPSNVMVTEDGTIKLIDFNAAHLYSPSKERDTRLLGTEGFAAPEQFGFGNSSERTDLYALGVLMKSLLTDENDYTHVSRRLNRIIKKCLEISPKDRYSNSAQLKSALMKL